MKRAALALAGALAATPSLASPLTDALAANGETLCFQEVAPAPAGQRWRTVRLSFAHDGNEAAPTLRLSLQGPGKPVLIYGLCSWTEDINRGGGGRILDPTFTATTGVTCFMVTDVTGSSAEEGGSFPIDWGDGQTLQFHLPFTVAAWRSWDTRKAATWPDIAVADRIVRVTRAPAEACRELVQKLAPAKP